MRIAIFTDAFLPQINGVVTATLNLAKGLADRNHKVYIIAPKFTKIKEFKYPNIKVIRIRSVPALFYPDFKFTSPFSPLLLRYLYKEKIDLIHFQTPLTLGIQGIIISKILGVPLVGTFHTLISHPEYLKHMGVNFKLMQKTSWQYAKAYYNRCNLITSPTEAIKKQLISKGFTPPIVAVSNGINPKIFDNSHWKELRNKLNPQGKILLFVGRIAYEKNLFYLFDCFKLILKKFPKTKLILVGDGPQMKQMRRRISSLGLEDKAILIGGIEHNKLVKSSIFKAADLFVTASLTETQGITLLEAQANGLVCVGVNAPGINSLIKDRYNGFLAKKGSKKDFADKVIKLLSNDSLRNRMSENTKEEIKRHYIKSIISIWESLYRGLINE